MIGQQAFQLARRKKSEGAAQTVLGIVGFWLPGLFAHGANAKLMASDMVAGCVAYDTSRPHPL